MRPTPLRSVTVAVPLLLAAAVAALPDPAAAQAPMRGEVRQIVTFSFLPGRTPEALEAYRSEAVPLYRRDEAMRSFRAFREVESPVPLDLVVVSAFDGMAGMDRSNARLRELAETAGTSLGAVYGRIGAMASGHTDEFVAMLPELGAGDPASRRLTAFVRYRVVPGQAAAFEEALGPLAAWAAEAGVASSTGRFLLSDGWDYVRVLGFDSLGDFERYRTAAGGAEARERVARLTAARRDLIVASVPELAVR